MLKCEFCGATKEQEIFVIGASREPDWCMIEGTGKMACPACYVKASNEGQAAIQKHVEAHNQRIK